MDKAQSIIEKLQASLTELDGRINAAQKDITSIKAEARERIEKELLKISEDKEKARYMITQLQQAGEGAFQDLRSGAEKAVAELKSSVLAALKRLNP